MRATRVRYPGVVVLELRGDFDSFMTRPFFEEIARLGAQEGVHRIVVNMRHVRFIGSSALGVLLRARKLCQAACGDLRVSEPSRAVREVVELLGLEPVIPLHASDQEALVTLG